MTIYDAVLFAGDETPAENTPSGGMNVMMIIFLVGMVAVMWFMSRRNKRQQQNQADFRDSLVAGQRVMTAGGMIGLISDVEGDVVTLMSPGGDQSVYVRRAIRSQVSDEEWEAMLAPYARDEEDEAPSGDEGGEADAAEEDGDGEKDS